MKTLYLLRHAKAERSAPSGEDFDRPLAERGRRDAEVLGRFLEARGTVPEFVLQSASRRTTETLHHLALGWRRTPPHEETRTLYLAEAGRIADCIRGLPNSCGSAMILGHNPGIEEFAGALAGRGAKDARKRLDESFPTCALAVFELEIDRWSDMSRATARLEAFYVAKDLAKDVDA